MSNVTIKLPALYEKQRRVFYSPARIVVCEASTKSGKSVGALHWMLSELIGSRRGTAGLWCSPVYDQARVMYRRVCRWFQIARVEEFERHDQRLYLTLPGGSTLWFKGSDKPDTIYGSDYSCAVIDESTRCKEDAWRAVLSTLTATGGPVRIIGNSRGRRNWAHRLGLRAKSGAANMEWHRITADDAIDAGVLRRDVVDEARDVLPEAVFRELYMAEPTEEGANPFGAQHIAAAWRAERPPGPAVCFGVDLGKRVDYTVIVGLNADGGVCDFDRFNGIDWPQAIDRIEARIGSTRAIIDSTGLGDPVTDELKRRCPLVEGFVFTARSKQQLLEGLAVALQRGDVHYAEEALRFELESMEYEAHERSVRYSAPPGVHDDCVMAAALAVSAWGRGRYTPERVLAWADAPEDIDDERMWQDARLLP